MERDPSEVFSWVTDEWRVTDGWPTLTIIGLWEELTLHGTVQVWTLKALNTSLTAGCQDLGGSKPTLSMRYLEPPCPPRNLVLPSHVTRSKGILSGHVSSYSVIWGEFTCAHGVQRRKTRGSNSTTLLVWNVWFSFWQCSGSMLVSWIFRSSMIDLRSTSLNA